jgi:hypothetical protein
VAKVTDRTVHTACEISRNHFSSSQPQTVGRVTHIPVIDCNVLPPSVQLFWLPIDHSFIFSLIIRFQLGGLYNATVWNAFVCLTQLRCVDSLYRPSLPVVVHTIFYIYRNFFQITGTRRSGREGYCILHGSN